MYYFRTNIKRNWIVWIHKTRYVHTQINKQIPERPSQTNLNAAKNKTKTKTKTKASYSL